MIVREARPGSSPPSVPLSSAVCNGRGDNAVVGQIVRPVVIRNLVDIANAESGLIQAEAIRAIALDGILLDTGATHMCLPQDLVDELGLRKSRDVVVETATSQPVVGMYQGAEIEIDGRTCEAEVVALPVGRPALFGVLAMEALGMKLNLVDQVIEYLPNSGIDNYIRA